MADKKPQMGSVDIKLTTPLKIAGADVTALRMREPTVLDELAMSESEGSKERKEIAMIANLCNVSPDDVQQLTLRDMGKVRLAFFRFLD